MSFNSILDAASRLDASRWTQLAWTLRAAHHADGKEFSKMVDTAWGHAVPKEQKQSRGIRDLLKDFGGGF